MPRLDHTVDEGFRWPEHRGLLLRKGAVAPLLDAMASWTPPVVVKWV
jgi:hypothetical protein